MPPLLENPRRLWVGLWLTALVLLALTWVLVMTVIRDSHDKALASAQENLFNLSRVSQEHTLRTLRATDQVVRFIEARYQAQGMQLNLAELAAQGVIDTSIFAQVGVIDENGILLLSNVPIKGRVDLSDREHFKVHAAQDTGELFISKPVLGRASGRWSIQLTRRMNHSDGSFAGVVVVSIAVDYFTQFYRELRLGDHGLMALYGTDGVARARKAGQDESTGSDASRSQAFERVRLGETDGFYTAQSVVDGVERLFHFRRVPGYNMLMIAAFDTEKVFQGHQKTQQILLLGATLVSVLIIALATAMMRYLMQLRHAMRLRERAQRQLEEHNQQLNTIFQLSPDGFVAFDAQRQVGFISPAVVQLTGQKSPPLLGMSEAAFSDWLRDLCVPHAAFAGVASLREQAATDDANMPVIELIKPPRRMLKVGLRASNSTQVSQIVYLRDVTHEVEVDVMKSEFMAAAAHELRTPMASILGYSEILLASPFEREMAHEFLTTIHTNSMLMSRILSDLLDLARIEARRNQDFLYQQLEVNAWLQAHLNTFQPPWGRNTPLLSVYPEPLWVSADPEKLRQALDNVLSNAYKYSPQGGPVHIRVTLRSAPQPAVCIAIDDQGIGMTPAQLARVCERFYRADASGQRPGTGLGMSIVKEIVDLHEGKLEMDSTPDEGTSVRLILPLVRAALPTSQPDGHGVDAGHGGVSPPAA
ncbi:MAG: hypothetical protein RLZZ352_17 [Pseudomonadota bacterium]|jgi:signal transduction histidine kinase